MKHKIWSGPLENLPDSKGQHFTRQEPFMTFEFDGVLGLGLASLAVDPEFSADPRAQVAVTKSAVEQP